jgi:hypothetical protein
MNRSFLVLPAALALLAACGQPYSPALGSRVPGIHGGGGVFGGGDGEMDYQTVSFDLLRSTITDVLVVLPANPPNAESPLLDPVGYLDANQVQLGEPVYSDGADASAAPGHMLPGGFKAWLLSASSACGQMMQSHETSLFPLGIDHYDFAYGMLLGRAPTADEISILDAVRLDPIWNGPGYTPGAKRQHQGAAVCTTILASAEFLTAN